ncbi:hypothetical protein NliqN6_0797 [Naganishia liquefaciens]|uniref:Multiple myeloma tumor-associated protein 2-like N-terminal domain-containing protein n=1 Tax=Naganishia liquefaciens TaxID=104408 RepID=A0A8H3TNN0_9TREE|nr:hypothetical protein NliqN6_0797 [Naganishia liquefaciens]
MFESVRGGTRGGAAEFKWSDVKADKDRENYLGHSINAPQGRWQNHKDIHWYSRNNSNISDAEAVRREKAREIKEIKMREENELSIALGYGPVHDLDKIGEGKEEAEGNGAKTERELELEKLEAEEKRRRKELKREKRAMKETEKQLRKQEKEERRLDSRSHRRDHGDLRVQDSADDENTTQKTVIMARLVFRTMIVVRCAKQGPVRTTRILRLVDAAHRQTPQMPGDPRLDMSDARNTTSKLNVHGIGNAGSGIMIQKHEWRVEGGDEHLSDGVGRTLKRHVRSGLLTKLQPHHLPLLFLYTCSLYLLTRPDLGQKIARFFSVSTSASVAAVSKSILPQWLKSRLPTEFPFAVPEKDDFQRTRDGGRPLLEPQLLSQAGQALISILSMVTGLLLSYKSSSALGKWEKGKGVWIGSGAGAGGMSGGVKGEIRSAVRMISLIHPQRAEDDKEQVFKETRPETASGSAQYQDALLYHRAGELVSLLVGFPFALHYHLIRSRPALQRPPLVDLLPKGYLSAIRRTDERVRFQSGDDMREDSAIRPSARSVAASPKSIWQKPHSPLRAKSRSVSRQRKVRTMRSSSSNEDIKAEPRLSFDDSDATYGQESCTSPQSDAGPESGLETANNHDTPSEVSRQVRQLNIPISTPEVISGMVHSGEDALRLKTHSSQVSRPVLNKETSEHPAEQASTSGAKTDLRSTLQIPTSLRNGRQRSRTPTRTQSRHEHLRYASAISSPFPLNLPLSIIRLIESYVNQFVAAEAWTSAQAEKGYLLTRTLTKILSEAEMLSENPPPLSLSIHLTHLLLLYLLAIPAQLMPVLGKYTVPVALVAGWGLLGVEALSREVGAVFGTNENHIPTYLYCAEILSETIDMSPLFLDMYTNRIRERLENDDELTGRLPELMAKGDSRVLMLSKLLERRTEAWIPEFK